MKHRKLMQLWLSVAGLLFLMLALGGCGGGGGGSTPALLFPPAHPDAVTVTSGDT